METDKIPNLVPSWLTQGRFSSRPSLPAKLPEGVYISIENEPDTKMIDRLFRAAYPDAPERTKE